MVFTLVFGLYGTVGGTIYVAAKAANNARLEVRVAFMTLLNGYQLTRSVCRVVRAVGGSTLTPGTHAEAEGSVPANHMAVRTVVVRTVAVHTAAVQDGNIGSKLSVWS